MKAKQFKSGEKSPKLPKKPVKNVQGGDRLQKAVSRVNADKTKG